MKENSNYTTYSDYDTVKQEIMLQHSIAIDAFNEYRMLTALGRHEKLIIPYLQAGKALRKLRHYAKMSGAWDEDTEEGEQLDSAIKNWNNNKTKPEADIEIMDWLENKFEEYFTQTNFYNLRIMEKHPGSALLKDKSY